MADRHSSANDTNRWTVKFTVHNGLDDSRRSGEFVITAANESHARKRGRERALYEACKDCDFQIGTDLIDVEVEAVTKTPP